MRINRIFEKKTVALGKWVRDPAASSSQRKGGGGKKRGEIHPPPKKTYQKKENGGQGGKRSDIAHGSLERWKKKEKEVETHKSWQKFSSIGKDKQLQSTSQYVAPQKKKKKW